jgi:hypothetical protein
LVTHVPEPLHVEPAVQVETHVSLVSLHVRHWAALHVGVPPPQTPLVQVVPVVQKSPSSQGVVLATGVYSHRPLMALQVPVAV